ncbi:MAG TPA: biopolymer transporter ExbD [Methylomirabilota bacterium]|jgi:biopolymer transport protein TolR|nr:biopolymer transporter ExbD [Methylomirabilota bacterium]
MAIKVDAGTESGARLRGSLAEINVIPLVDVVLVLLLIFMLTAPMMYRGIDVNLPRTSGRPTAIEERLVLTITKDRLLFLNERALPLTTLEARLRELLRDRTDKTIFIKADKELAYGYVVETMDRVRRAGVDRVGMVTEPLLKRE